MTKFILSLLLCLAVVYPPRAHAHCGVQCQVQSAFVATTYAVPVAIPVALSTPYQYGYQAAPTINVSLHLDAAAITAIRGEQPLRYGAKLETPTPTPLPPQPDINPDLPPKPRPEAPAVMSVFQQRCLKCHASANEALHRPSLAGVLTCEQRVACINAIVFDRMPKGGPALTPDEAGELIRYLSAK